jgi:hypothetical protein
VAAAAAAAVAADVVAAAEAAAYVVAAVEVAVVGAVAQAAVAAVAADAVASSLEPASAALGMPVAARATPRPVGYGRQVGDGSIAVHRRLSSHHRRLSHCQPNNVWRRRLAHQLEPGWLLLRPRGGRKQWHWQTGGPTDVVIVERHPDELPPLKVKNPAAPAVTREAEEDWGGDAVAENSYPIRKGRGRACEQYSGA